MLPKAGSHVQPIRYPSVTYNDMTKPEGSWQKKYDEMDAEYSRYMYAGLATLAVSAVIVGYFFLEIIPYSSRTIAWTRSGILSQPTRTLLKDWLS